MGIIDDLEEGRWKNLRRNRNRWWFKHWMRGVRLRRLRKQRRQVKAKKTSTSTRPASHQTRIPTVLVVIAIIGAVIIATLVWYAASLLENIPWGSVGWVALWSIAAASVVAFLIWLFRSQTRRDYAGRATQSGWLWWPVGMLVVAVLVVGIVRYCITSAAPAVDPTFTVEAGKDWSEPIRVPLGGRIQWERVDQEMAYEFRDQTGTVYSRTRGPKEYTEHPGRLASVQFRTLEEKPIIIRVRLTR